MKRQFHNKLTLLNHLAECVSHQIAEVTDNYLDQPNSVLQQPAADGGWSVIECLAHLNTYSDYYLPLVSKTLTDQPIQPEGTYKASWLGNYIINLMKDTTGKKYKAKAIHQPPKQLNAYSTMVTFIHNQDRLTEYIKQAKTVNLSKGRIAMSILPFFKLSLGDVLEFMVVHQERHLLQAHRNYRSQKNITRANQAV